MEERYNELLKIQNEYYGKMCANVEDFEKTEHTKEELEKFKLTYGLTKEELQEMRRTKRAVDITLKELKASGIVPTTTEIIKGFEVV